MSDIKDSPRFVDFGLIPRIDISAKLSDVFDRLAQAEKGGFLAVRDSNIEFYVNSGSLGHNLLKESGNNLDRFRELTSKPLGALRTSEWAKRSFIEIPSQQVRNMPTDDDARSQLGNVLVIDHTRPLGIFFHGLGDKETFVKPVTFCCTNPKQRHKNTRITTGRCQVCPYPLGNPC